MIIYAKEGVEGLYRRVMMDIRLSNFIMAAPIGVFCALAPAFYRLWMPSLDAWELTVLSILTISNFIPWAGPQVAYNIFTVMNRLKLNSASFLGGAVLNFISVLLALNFTDLGVYAIAGISSIISVARNLLIIAPYVSSLLNKPWWTIHREVLVSLISVAGSAVVALVFGFLIPAASWGGLIVTVLVSCLVSWLVVFLMTFSHEQRIRYLGLVKARFVNN